MTARFILSREELAEAVALWLPQKLEMTITPDQVTPSEGEWNEEHPDFLDSLTVIVDDITTKAANSPRN